MYFIVSRRYGHLDSIPPCQEKTDTRCVRSHRCPRQIGSSPRKAIRLRGLNPRAGCVFQVIFQHRTPRTSRPVGCLPTATKTGKVFGQAPTATSYETRDDSSAGFSSVLVFFPHCYEIARVSSCDKITVARHGPLVLAACQSVVRSILALDNARPPSNSRYFVTESNLFNQLGPRRVFDTNDIFTPLEIIRSRIIFSRCVSLRLKKK